MPRRQPIPRGTRGLRTGWCATGNRARTEPPFRIASRQTVDSAVIQRETSASVHGRSPDVSVGPLRTCVGCRKRELAVELLRVVAVDGNGEYAITVDPARRLPGRGAWLHPTRACLDAAIRRRAFARALRITGSPDITAVVEHFTGVEALEPPGNRTGSEEHEHTVKSR
ncbi:MAG TPA: YlxR family protein [Mycobacterium sp.]|nr:YlxR family protein [Mycobacterium sp.]